MDITNHNDHKRFEGRFIVIYVGESNVKMTSNKERELFWWLDIKDQLKLLWAWVNWSSGIIMRILQIIMILKALKVSLLWYMYIHLMWECSNKERDLFWWLDIKDQFKFDEHELSEVMA